MKLNIGCGWRDFGKDWISIDGGEYEHLDSKDILNLPYNDNTVDLVYASHTLEYFDRLEAIDVLVDGKSLKLEEIQLAVQT